MFTSAIKNTSEGRKLLINIIGVIVSSEYWTDETGLDVVSQKIEEFDATENDEIIVSINSPGGDYFAGVCIYNKLKESPAKVTTKNLGLASSAACVIFMAGDERVVYQGSSTMTHDPLTDPGMVNADQMRVLAEELDQICESAKGVFLAAGIDADKLVELMKAETLMTPAQALENGFATKVNDTLQVTNCFRTADKESAINNQFRHRVGEPEQSNEPPAAPAIANMTFIANALIENECTDLLPHFSANSFTEREINDKVSRMVAVRNSCEAAGLDYENIKFHAIEGGADFINAVVTEAIATNENLDIDDSNKNDTFQIKPQTGIN